MYIHVYTVYIIHTYHAIRHTGPDLITGFAQKWGIGSTPNILMQMDPKIDQFP